MPKFSFSSSSSSFKFWQLVLSKHKNSKVQNVKVRERLKRDINFLFPGITKNEKKEAFCWLSIWLFKTLLLLLCKQNRFLIKCLKSTPKKLENEGSQKSWKTRTATTEAAAPNQITTLKSFTFCCFVNKVLPILLFNLTFHLELLLVVEFYFRPPKMKVPPNRIRERTPLCRFWLSILITASVQCLKGLH